MMMKVPAENTEEYPTTSLLSSAVNQNRNYVQNLQYDSNYYHLSSMLQTCSRRLDVAPNFNTDAGSSDNRAQISASASVLVSRKVPSNPNQL